MTPEEKIAAVRARRAAVKAAGRRLPRKRRPPRQLYPHGLEREYERAVQRITGPFFEAVNVMVKSDLAALTAARDQALRTDSLAVVRHDAPYGEMIGRVFAGIRVNVAAKISEAAAADTANTFAQRVNDFNRGQVDRQFSAVLGIPVLRQERWLKEKISAFVTGNVALIKDISDKGIADVQSLLMARVEAGDSNATIAKAIAERLDTTRRRAQFIARDQVARLNGKLTELRQKEAGVSQYIWRAITDGATRASHLRNNAKTFRWDDPPETGHPGEDFQCRCTAEPVLDEFVSVPVREAA